LPDNFSGLHIQRTERPCFAAKVDVLTRHHWLRRKHFRILRAPKNESGALVERVDIAVGAGAEQRDSIDGKTRSDGYR
jgi:hypothetical protein